MRIVFVDPGALRREMVLMAPVTTADGSGGHELTWVEEATVYGMIEPVSQESRFGAGQMRESHTHRITIRHRAGVASGMRLVRQSRIFEILTVHDPDETGRYLVCRAKERDL
ncbi:MAG: phage head closure protein [Rhizobiaceae bacterium]|nr:phage head closure protein [Rhizobiaceae bacterium]